MFPGVRAATTPDKPAVIMGGSGARITYRQLEARSIQLARLLRDRGFRTGDRVAIFAENHPRYFEVYWAAMRSGLYLTAINRHLSPEEAAFIVNDSGSTALITTAERADRAMAICDLIPDCHVRLVLDGPAAGFEPYEALIAAQDVAPLEDQPRGEVMLYSSGTTGRPKGVKRPLTGKQIDDPTALGISSFERHLLGMSEATVYLCPAPLYHAAALQWSAGVHEMGGTVVVMERFDAAGSLELVERHRVTHTQVVPTMLVRMLELPDEVRTRPDVSSLQCVVHAAAPCPVEVKRAVIDWLGPIVSEYYAATEGNGLTFVSAEDWLAHPGTVGRPIIGVPHICDDDGRELGVGEVGTIYFERDEVVFEYHKDEGRTRASQHPDHATWSAPGDVGYLDDEGYLYLSDRRAFTIISGGVNIYPAAIEACLVVHPKVTDVAVFGLADEEMGEFVQAVVELADGVEVGPALVEERRAHVRSRLAGYVVPRAVDFRAELPRMPTSKLSKGLLRDEYLEARP